MTKFTPSKNLEIYQSEDSSLSRQDYIELIERETRDKYPHLHVSFYPDWCMQAKITVKCPPGSLLTETPPILIDLLKNANFHAETFTHHLSQTNSSQDKTQYVLTNTELKKIGYQFVMKAIFGPAFISFWFRNDSFAPRLDLPVFYALEILNQLNDQIQVAQSRGLLTTSQSTHLSPATDSVKNTKAS